MMTNNQKKMLLEKMLSELELPESAYERAKDRYDDLGEWLGRDESTVQGFEPHIYPQGSFRLGTAIRPVHEEEAYDLDLACKIQQGITKGSSTQEGLKALIGNELELYRKARNIAAPLEEKHRCWRLEYQDHLNFHMDIVPCIPADDDNQGVIFESLRKAWTDDILAESVAHLTVSITDDRHPRYRSICDDWNISNPDGYAKWFESRMNESLRMLLEKAQVDDIPVYKRKTPLQRCVQLLKCHRDLMFKDDSDVKPISIIITTLAAQAYDGEVDLYDALSNILARMGDLVNSTTPKVPNPVNPSEDFADRWAMPKYKHLKLEENFWTWLRQVRSDFDNLTRSEDATFIAEQANQRFRARMDVEDLRKSLGLAQGVSIIVPKAHSIEAAPPKPWERD
ncbi:nucleotidyltransferase domain-containing protein [Geobacter benzoatilyticus]|uniref:Cyclic GMP-AMP synthase n=1 Tax=Geobacter benzoatilyticus TaxID=2815309 RepID=A0ABX7Q6C6_9BACT|nr:nucleotidyltransferase [Geobacter benzoatilyticus]QSV46909.1 nucleotidyltransferase [Geobacter benzoatilyticus]